MGLVAQRITRLTTDQKIPGSNPGKLEFFDVFFFTLLCLYTVCVIGNFDLRDNYFHSFQYPFMI